VNLLEIIKKADKESVAVGHFNISELAALRAITKASKELKVPVVVGVSEGERDFIGVKQVVALIRILRKEGTLVFLNADHTYSLEKIKEVVQAGFDAVIFDGAKLPFEENIKKTKEVVDYAKAVNPEIIVEGELGYIGSSSKILEEVPEGAAVKEEDLTKPEDAKRFVEETGVDLLAPAVGNIHGMFKNSPNPSLNAERVKAVREATNVPLVLHGGSGISDNDFKAVIKAGISLVHINTEIRLAWRNGMASALNEKPDEVTPYKLLPAAEEAVYEVVKRRLKLFSGLD